MTRPTAEETYQERQGDIRALLEMLKDEVQMHSEFTLHANWGHVGDLGRIRQGLVEALAFLAQQDEQFVEKRLAKHRASRK